MRKSDWGKGLVCWMRWLATACLLAGMASSAFATKTYSDNGDGTVTDPTTGLTWMRCSMGQTFTGGICAGTSSTYNWTQANALTGTVNFAGKGDWRLPNVRELQSIVDRSRYSPSVDSVAFPNMKSANFWDTQVLDFWSDSPFLSILAESAWSVDFGEGHVDSSYNRSNYFGVRLVRGGQSLGLLDIARPATDYVDNGDGTVTHTPTSLMWQRCAVGQIWSGSTCSGTAILPNWDAAKLLTSSFAGRTDWRLPTEDELLSLVDYTRYSPAMNSTIFPNAPSSEFWSESPQVSWSGYAWKVNFGYGFTWFGNSSSGYGGARLVSGRQSLGSFVLTVSKTGNGAVTSSPTGTDCGAVCSASFNTGTSVTLTPTPATGSTFGGWSGACTGTGSCVVIMSAAQSVTAAFNAIIPTVSLTPSSLSFAAQAVGTTSAAKTVTLTNTSAAVVNIAGIVANGDFARTTTCGATLAPSASCTIDVTFNPTVAGSHLSSLVITSNAASSPNTISLSGTGASLVPVCSLSTSPSSIFAGGSSTLTASCTPAATSYFWTGGACVGNVTSSCTVSPAGTTSYTVQGSNAVGNGNIASASVSVVATPPVFAAGLYDGIYQWSRGNYLSLHQDGTHLIATIYFNADGSFSFPATSGTGILPVPQLDIFDLMNGQVSGSTVRMNGTRFHRTCNVAYDFAFNIDATITVTRVGVSNTAEADAAGISCSAIVGAEPITLSVPKLRFNPDSTPVANVGLYDGIYQWSSGNYLSLHQDGTHMIATIYFNADGSFSFPATTGTGVLPVPQLDIFDLMDGQVAGSTVKMNGTRFHRACNVIYDFTFNNDATITVTRTGVGNTAATDAAGISCSAIVGAEPIALSVRKLRFNPNTAPVANAGSAQNVVAGTLVTLDGSASADADGNALTYTWALTTKPAGSAASLSSATSVKPSFIADLAGTYIATLVVNDGTASSSSVSVSIAANGTVSDMSDLVGTYVQIVDDNRTSTVACRDLGRRSGLVDFSGSPASIYLSIDTQSNLIMQVDQNVSGPFPVRYVLTLARSAGDSIAGYSVYASYPYYLTGTGLKKVGTTFSGTLLIQQSSCLHIVTF